jgi:hypothetical protein
VAFKPIFAALPSFLSLHFTHFIILLMSESIKPNPPHLTLDMSDAALRNVLMPSFASPSKPFVRLVLYLSSSRTSSVAGAEGKGGN